MAAIVYFTLNMVRKQTFSMVGEERRVDRISCAAERLDNELFRDPPGFLSAMRWPGWIALTGIKILFVIETQTSTGSLNSGKREWRGEGERWMRHANS